MSSWKVLLWSGCIAGVLLPAIGNCQGIEYPKSTDKERAAEIRSTPWIELIRREVKPLKHDLGKQMPMIMWQSVGFARLTSDQIRVLSERGLCQHLQFNEQMIPAARALQSAGLPVVLMEGRTDSWPYSLAEDSDQWAHHLDLSYRPGWVDQEEPFEWFGACPNQTAGWRRLADQTRKTMQAFRDAGIQVDAVWVDYEGDPYPWAHLFEQLRHCKRCRRELPASVVHNELVWRDFAWKKYVSLYDRYFAKPIREVFPECSVTNWHVLRSTAENPIRYFVNNDRLPAIEFEFFTATNPIAYASDKVFLIRFNQNQVPLSQKNVDDFYRSELLQQVTADKQNRAGDGNVMSVPWVARFCDLDQKETAPMMTRKAYRAALAEMWASGIATMQIFNPIQKGYEEYAITELQDAVLSLDQFLSQ